MDHKFKSLLQNVATRHVIAPMKEGNAVRQQLENLRKLDVVNYFLLGNLNNIKRMLDVADAINYFNRKFAWFAITQDRGELRCACRDATVMFAKPTVDNQYQDRLGLLKTSYSLNFAPEITSVFYFDFALQSFLAAR